jgi:hypothetical protein
MAGNRYIAAPAVIYVLKNWQLLGLYSGAHKKENPWADFFLRFPSNVPLELSWIRETLPFRK